MRVLITYGSKRGGTAGIAEIIAHGLRDGGHTADIVTPRSGVDVRAYDAVIIGGALYANRWHGDARRFVRRHTTELRERLVWLFSSGPLDDSANQAEIPPTRQVARLSARIGARGHVTFGGRLAQNARGFLASRMAKTHAGDWRDEARIKAWAAETASALHHLPARTPPAPAAPDVGWPGERRTRRVALACCLFSGVTAGIGGLALALLPDGSALRTPLTPLEYAGFATFRVPGLLLLAVVGLANLAGALALAVTRNKSAEVIAFIAGTALTVLIVGEMLILRSAHWLQLLYLVMGTVTIVEALKLRERREPPRGLLRQRRA